MKHNDENRTNPDRWDDDNRETQRDEDPHEE